MKFNKAQAVLAIGCSEGMKYLAFHIAIGVALSWRCRKCATGWQHAAAIRRLRQTKSLSQRC